MGKTSAFITLLTVELLLPHSHSLKEKRRVLRGLKERIRSKFNASVAETAYQDKWQRAVLAVCLVGSDKHHLLLSSAQISNLCKETPDIIITVIEQQWL
ncbi:MAG: DUF503 domain-containing protein [Psychromonas sp.]|nr:DUF503 domain-containing protein [Psychromonas sp.]